MNGSGNPINTPEWPVEHLKSEVRATVWCGLRYDIGVSRATPQTEKPVCEECQKIEDGEAPSKAPIPLFYGR